MDRKFSKPLPVKIFLGIISSEVALFEELLPLLEKMLGPSDIKGPVWPWEHTDYYKKEMGENLKKQFIFFHKLADPGTIADIKLKTVELEKKYLNNEGGRRVNLDPGYLDSARVVLVSTDDYSHRVYIGKGIYGEATLIYSGNDFQILPYTYPDFRLKEYHALFKKARSIYQTGLKSLPAARQA